MTRTKLAVLAAVQVERRVLMAVEVEHSLPVVQDLQEQITALPYRVQLLVAVTRAEAEAVVADILAAVLVTALQDTPAVEVLVTTALH
jgi:hypothetical protein